MSGCFLANVCHTIITMWFKVYMFANVSISTLICCCVWTLFVKFWNSMYFWILIQLHFQVCIQLSLPKSYDQMLKKKLQSFISLISFMALTISLANINSKILKIELLFHLLLHIHHVHIILSITFKKETVNFVEWNQPPCMWMMFWQLCGYNGWVKVSKQ